MSFELSTSFEKQKRQVLIDKKKKEAGFPSADIAWWWDGNFDGCWNWQRINCSCRRRELVQFEKEFITVYWFNVSKVKVYKVLLNFVLQNASILLSLRILTCYTYIGFCLEKFLLSLAFDYALYNWIFPHRYLHFKSAGIVCIETSRKLQSLTSHIVQISFAEKPMMETARDTWAVLGGEFFALSSPVKVGLRTNPVKRCGVFLLIMFLFLLFAQFWDCVWIYFPSTSNDRFCI